MGRHRNFDPASDEAWGHFFAAWVTGDPLLENYDAGFGNVFHWNCENGEWGINGAVSGSANDYGDSSEAAVAGMLWDVFDQANDDYDGDGIGDTLSDGIDNILVALLDRTVNGHHPDNIDEFWEAWFQSPSLTHCQAMTDIWYEHGDSACCSGSRMASSVCNSCCVGTRGDVNYDGVDLDMVDQTCIIDFMFGLGCDRPCREEADVNGDGAVSDIVDMTFVVDYLFGQAPTPVPCP